MRPNAAATGRNPARASARAVRRRKTGAWPEAPGLRAAVALVMVAALLVCHGLLGASHVLGHGAVAQAATPTGDLAAQDGPEDVGHAPHGSLSGAHHAVGEADEENQRDPSGPSLGTAGYFAVLLTLAGVALLAVIFRSRRADPSPRWSVHALRTAPRISPLPRGPSPPLLQVFRL